jgi:response regulator RpfG family c-di-GMP phosphodiesterase
MKSGHNGRKPTILLLVDRRQSRTARVLKELGYGIMTTYTADHAVAICVNNRVDAVLLDQPHFIETEGWSVAKSIKMIRARICVILVVRGKVITPELPEGVDAVVAERDHERLMQIMERILPRSSTQAAACE